MVALQQVEVCTIRSLRVETEQCPAGVRSDVQTLVLPIFLSIYLCIYLSVSLLNNLHVPMHTCNPAGLVWSECVRQVVQCSVVNVMLDGGMRRRPGTRSRRYHGQSTVRLPSLAP